MCKEQGSTIRLALQLMQSTTRKNEHPRYPKNNTHKKDEIPGEAPSPIPIRS
jgi:hypothetical protein